MKSPRAKSPRSGKPVETLLEEDVLELPLAKNNARAAAVARQAG